MTIQTHTTTAEPEPAALISGPKGTKILLGPAEARRLKAQRPARSGLKGAPRPTVAITSAAATDATDASDSEEGKANAL